MYRLSRLLLIVAVTASVYDVAVIAVIAWPASLWLGLAVALFGFKKALPRLTSHGSARWAGRREIRPMLDAPAGLILGQLAIDGDEQR